MQWAFSAKHARVVLKATGTAILEALLKCKPELSFVVAHAEDDHLKVHSNDPYAFKVLDCVFNIILYGIML